MPPKNSISTDDLLLWENSCCRRMAGKPMLRIIDPVFGSHPMLALHNAGMETVHNLENKLASLAADSVQRAAASPIIRGLFIAPNFRISRRTAEYYLFGDLEDEAQTKYHLRFENKADRADFFHLTCEDNLGRINCRNGRMNGHLFFRLREDGVVTMLEKTKLGQFEEYSDIRLIRFAPEVIAMIYYMMYNLA